MRKIFIFKTYLLDLIREEKKTSTIRRGKMEVARNILFTNYHEFLNGICDSITHKKFADITEEDVRTEGMSFDEFKKKMIEFYPTLSNDEIMTIIHFHISDMEKRKE